jgi:glycosyltransferase involved in cell wall biosynthesis
MPRRGRAIAERLAAAEPRLALAELDGLDEHEVAALMRRAGVYLATAEDEWFGLPALEAMAAGCLVFSVPVRGGMEYLEDGVTACVGPVEHLEQQIGRLLDPDLADHWRAMRHAAMARALDYRLDAQLPRVRALAEHLGPAACRPLAPEPAIA